jgi:exopolysaccharide biosynthesis polyprenyl glycosylphosphotransferase
MASLDTFLDEAPVPALRPDRIGERHTGARRAPKSKAAGSDTALDQARRRDARYRRLLAIGDVSALAAALGLGLVAQGEAVPVYALLLAPAMVVLAKASGLYDRDQHLIRKGTLDELPKLFHLSVLVAFTVALAEHSLVPGGIETQSLLAFAALLFVGLAAARSAARWVARRSSAPERCVVLGNGGIAEDLARGIETWGGATVELVGQFDATGTDICKLLTSREIDRVVLTPGSERNSDILSLIGEIRRLGIKISVLPSVSRAGGNSFEIERIDGITLLGMRGFEFSRSSKILKRSMDLLISVVVLIVVMPVMLLVALAIKLETPGPVFYRQARIGRHGTQFKMLKFRTMHRGADQLRVQLDHLNEARGGLFKIAKDPRVTRVGRLLRSLSVDELPQLWNVVRGEMSLVGPRPLVGEEDKLIQGWHRQRLALAPGMTGYWQVLGSARVPLEDMVKLDYAYVQNWSAWGDVQLMLRTIPFIAARRGL